MGRIDTMSQMYFTIFDKLNKATTEQELGEVLKEYSVRVKTSKLSKINNPPGIRKVYFSYGMPFIVLQIKTGKYNLIPRKDSPPVFSMGFTRTFIDLFKTSYIKELCYELFD